jgi:hypothetical protein
MTLNWPSDAEPLNPVNAIGLRAVDTVMTLPVSQSMVSFLSFFRTCSVQQRAPLIALHLAGSWLPTAYLAREFRKLAGKIALHPDVFSAGGWLSRGAGFRPQVWRRMRSISATATPQTCAAWATVMPYFTHDRMRANCERGILPVGRGGCGRSFRLIR